jgi:hypothetical protein
VTIEPANAESNEPARFAKPSDVAAILGVAPISFHLNDENLLLEVALEGGRAEDV